MPTGVNDIISLSLRYNKSKIKRIHPLLILVTLEGVLFFFLAPLLIKLQTLVIIPEYGWLS